MCIRDRHWPDPLAAAVCPPAVCFAQVHHFKWVAGLCERLQHRVSVRRAHADPFWIESRRVLDYLEPRQARFDVRDPAFLIDDCTSGYRHWPEVTALACAIAERHYSRRGIRCPWTPAGHAPV